MVSLICEQNSPLKDLFGKSLSASNLKSRYARSLIPFAGPIEGYASLSDRDFEQN